MPRTRKSRGGRTVGESFREYGRGIAGGLLFSLPLLYTMEVWFAGFLMPPHRQLAYVLGGLVLHLRWKRDRERWYFTSRCTGCGYDLRNSASDRCPECGKVWWKQ